MRFVLNNLTAITGNIQKYSPVQAEDSDQPLSTSYLGTPIYDTIILSGENTDLGEGVSLRIDTALISISLFKNIVRTPINGRNGTVKEYIAADDYNIQINGYIVSEAPNLYPKDDVKLLQEFIELNTQIKVSSGFLNNIFKVTTIVIEEGTITQEPGFRNRVPFALRCLSDEDIELQITDDAYSA